MGETLDRILPDPREFRYGAVASDEPAATIAARAILLEGGTAADAAVALYFTLAVTAPSVASLGAGGVCLVHNPLSGKVEVLDFIAPAAVGETGAANPIAVPTAVRGMAALHGRYGRLAWAKLPLNAERLARSGQSVSRRLADDLVAESGRILSDGWTRRQFADRDGAPLRAGDPVRQIELGSIIGQIRGRGAGAFYTGPLAARVLEGIRMAGGTLSPEELRRYLPKWRPAVSVYFGRDQMHAVGPPAASGLVAAQIWQMLVTDYRYVKAPTEERPHLLVEAVRRAVSRGDRWTAMESAELSNAHLSGTRARELLRDYDPASVSADGVSDGAVSAAEATAGTGFAVVDASGMAVTCTVSLNRLFGIGRIAPGTGIFPARAPSAGIEGPSSLGPVMVTRPADKTFRLAIAGTGGFSGSSAMAQVAAGALLEKLPLDKAMAAPRIHPGSTGAVVTVEAGEADTRIAALSRRGYTIRRGDVLGRLNAVFCPAGLPADAVKWSDCSAVADPRGGGLGQVFLFERE